MFALSPLFLVDFGGSEPMILRICAAFMAIYFCQRIYIGYMDYRRGDAERWKLGGIHLHVLTAFTLFTLGITVLITFNSISNVASWYLVAVGCHLILTGNSLLIYLYRWKKERDV